MSSPEENFKSTSVSLSGLSIPARHFPSHIVAPWRRFSSGLWRIPEGDISQAYSGDIFPNVKAFTEEGQLFTNCGASYSKCFKTTVQCYPLLPVEGPSYETAPYSYQGRIGRFKGTTWRLGPKVEFVSDEPTAGEWIELLRSQYADGGYFANQFRYAEFLETVQKEASASALEAINRELSGPFRQLSKEELKNILDGSAKALKNPDERQMPLF